MGEYANMRLDGTCCSSCGVFLENGLEGFPQMCGGCAKEWKDAGSEIIDTGSGTFQDVTPVNNPKQLPKQLKFPCPDCGKYVAITGLEQHNKAKH
jgi:predicted RNA-binding Zn-ribbon protein involved in translation (DUF1610 family)